MVDTAYETMLMSEDALRAVWDTPQEDEAWAYLSQGEPMTTWDVLKKLSSATDSNAPWITVDQAQPTAVRVWRCVRVYHLPPAENGSRHNVFINASIDGQLIRNGSLSAQWGWDGQRADEIAPPVRLDKPAPEPCGDVPIFRDAHLWVKIVSSDGYPSDTVRNLHTNMPGDGVTTNNGYGHHSYIVDYELQHVTVTDPVTPPIDCAECQRQLAEMQAKIDEIRKLVSSWTGD